MRLQNILHVRTHRDGVVSRRHFLASAAAAGAGLFGWREAIAQSADELRRQHKACILLFMRGGPSQFETLDPKPGHANSGPTEAIDSAVAGVRLASAWTNVAREMNHISLIRS